MPSTRLTPDKEELIPANDHLATTWMRAWRTVLVYCLWWGNWQHSGDTAPLYSGWYTRAPAGGGSVVCYGTSSAGAGQQQDLGGLAWAPQRADLCADPTRPPGSGARSPGSLVWRDRLSSSHQQGVAIIPAEVLEQELEMVGDLPTNWGSAAVKALATLPCPFIQTQPAEDEGLGRGNSAAYRLRLSFALARVNAWLPCQASFALLPWVNFRLAQHHGRDLAWCSLRPLAVQQAPYSWHAEAFPHFVGSVRPPGSETTWSATAYEGLQCSSRCLWFL